MPTIVNLISDVISEVIKFQEPAYRDAELDKAFPGLIPADNGESILVSNRIDTLITKVARQMFLEDHTAKTKFTVEEWRTIIRNAFGVALLGLELNNPLEQNSATVLKLIRDQIARFAEEANELEFAYGCTLFSDDQTDSFKIGAVIFEARSVWLNRKYDEGNISKISKRRIEKKWAGKRLSKRKPSLDQSSENGVLDAIARCPYVCSVKVTSYGKGAAKEKSLIAARLALTAISLRWQIPSKVLSGLNLIYDREFFTKKTLMFARSGISLAGSSISHFPRGPYMPPGDWNKELEKNSGYFSLVGEVISYLLSPSEDVKRPRLMSTLAQSMLWFHEACRESVTLMGIVKFSASMDALCCGRKAGGILSVLEKRVGLKRDHPIQKDGPSLGRIVNEIYSDGRSRTIHGTNDKFGEDWAITKGLAEYLARLCLWGCMELAKDDLELNDPLKFSE